MVILAGTLVTLGAILPSLAWLFFFLREDVHPEPKRLIAYVFSLGALSTIPVLFVQVGLQEFLQVFLTNLPAVVLLAFSEELFKFLAAWFGTKKDPAYDEPVDAMIYMVAAALGFAAVENLFIIGGVLDSAAIAPVASATSIILLRFVGATLLHVLASALLGYYWAKRNAAWGLIVATAVHSVFNYLILAIPVGNLLYAGLFLVVAAFFVFQDFEKLKTV
ncbi:MAG: PrsW family intramembrane metalloprotease [Candidatus Brennerbacteria bacterium]|nr:PrsW family intramembrane metalloprotease [Candidatus Brennerbacteria bacterium]